MNTKFIFVIFLGFLLPVFMFAQNKEDLNDNIGSIKNKDKSTEFENQVGIPDLDNINPLNNSGATPEFNSSVFSITPVDGQNILSENITSKIIPLKSSKRPVPVALYVNNSIKGLEGVLSNPVEIAYGILSNSEVKAQMGIQHEKNFHIVSSEKDDLGMTHIKMNQYYKGILIYGGQIYIHYKSGKAFSFINGRWYKEEQIQNAGINTGNLRNKSDFAFLLSEKQIKNIITQDLSVQRIKIKRKSDFGERFKPDRIWTINKMLYFNENNQSFSSVFVVDIIADPMHTYKYILDSKRGNILRKQKEYCSIFPENKELSPSGSTIANSKDLSGVTRKINVFSQNGDYFMIDASRDMFDSGKGSLPYDPIGVIWTLDANNTSPNDNSFNNNLTQIHSGNNTWSPLSVSAHYNAGFAFDYYNNKFNRNSINGNGGNVISIINVADEDGNSMDNAFWGGSAMFYGNGDKTFTSPLAKSLDVSGHELTHGVIQSTANLEYYGESGAINESFADVFGAMMDRDDWQMGEDVVNSQYFPSGALRDLSNPHNGASQGSYAWQPAHTNEQYHGEEDNGGVHVNSGITNFAFYKFAKVVGKEKAENVYYRALTFYLTKSSKFVDLRVAIEQSAEDLYGSDVQNAASNAFNAVGIGEGGNAGGSGNQTDLKINPGNDFVICTDENQNGLYLLDGSGHVLNNGSPISNTAVQSKPSITDDGMNVVFVGDDNKIHYIFFDWSNNTYEESIIQDQPIWRNVVVSKGGNRIAALYAEVDKNIAVFDFVLEQWKDFELKNPTTVQGVELGNVEYADAMEFDYSGEWIMYDCKNVLSSNGNLDIDYWDIGFINVWDNSKQDFAQGRTEKLFSELPENVSIGNPVFSKNSPYIISFDYIDDQNYNILGANIETGDVKLIFSNAELGYPNYSKNDKKLLFNYYNSGENIAVIDLNSDKISPVMNSSKYFVQGAKWGVWFANGIRDLKLGTNDAGYPIVSNTVVYPNPVEDVLNIKTKDFASKVKLTVFDVLGNKQIDQIIPVSSGLINVDISLLKSGNYFVKITDGFQYFSEKIMVIK